MSNLVHEGTCDNLGHPCAHQHEVAAFRMITPRHPEIHCLDFDDTRPLLPGGEGSFGPLARQVPVKSL